MKKEKSLYINLLTDFGFKRTFGDTECLINFLNALFEKDKIVIKSLKYIDRERTPRNSDERLIFYDLLCELDNGTTLIIEMQRRSQKYFKDRTMFYLSRSIVDQGANKRHWDYHCDKVFAIYFTNFHIPVSDLSDSKTPESPALDKPVSQYMVKDVDTNEVYSDKFRMFVIDLKAFNIENEDSLGSDLDGWIFNIKNMGKYKTRPKLADKEPFKRLFELSEVANLTVAEYRNYSRSLKRYWDSCAVEDTDNWRYERGKEYGIREGKMEGKIEGKIDSAMQMFSKGFDRQTVIDVLELTDDEVRIFDERIKKSES